MTWTEVSRRYADSLSAALEVRRRALELAEISAAQVSSAHHVALRADVLPLERQLKRLERGEFRVAVVGLEKAGKSTFVNAWLEYDLLPSDGKRCTFTTTQVFSVASDTEQRVEVEPKNADEFRRLRDELEAAAGGSDSDRARTARADLEVIRANEKSLREVLMSPPGPRSFRDLSEVTEHLRRYVADPTVAHAVREVRVYTSRLSTASGVVFYDVPGLNSGLAKHLEESRAMLADCDAVICIQDSGRPSLEAHEQKLVTFAREGDVVEIASKLFVFFGRIDTLGTPQALARHLEEARGEWHRLARLPSQRIVAGSAGSHLLLTGTAGEEVRRRMGRIDEARLCEVAGVERSVEATGISRIKDLLAHYLEHERIAVLQSRCDGPIQTNLRVGREVFDDVRSRFPDDPEDARRAEERRQEIDFSEWCDRHMKTAQSRMVDHFKVLLDERDAATIAALRQRYEDVVRRGLQELPSRGERSRAEIFSRTSIPVFDARKANYAWREQLYQDTFALLDRVASELSAEILEETDRSIDFLTDLLWGARDVRERLTRDRIAQYQTLVKAGLSALFLRFARPVAEATVRSPLGSQTRSELSSRLGPDIELADGYYKGSRVEYRELKKWAKYGRALLDDPAVREIVLGIVPPGLPQAAVTGGMKLVAEVREAATGEDVQREVEADLEALEEYLVSSAFDAAGLRALRDQELGRIRDAFTRLQGTWTGVARNEWRAGNERLLRDLPESLRGQSFHQEVAGALRQLREALDRAQSPVAR